MKKRTKQLLITAGTVAVITASSIGGTPTFAKTSQQPQSSHVVRKKSHDKLADALASGSITDEQYTKILTKREELRLFHANVMKLSATDRKAEMATKKAELKRWATENNVPLDLLGFGLKKPRFAKIQ